MNMLGNLNLINIFRTSFDPNICAIVPRGDAIMVQLLARLRRDSRPCDAAGDMHVDIGNHVYWCRHSARSIRQGEQRMRIDGHFLNKKSLVKENYN